MSIFQNTVQKLQKAIKRCVPFFMAVAAVVSAASVPAYASGGDLQKVSHTNYSFPAQYGWSYRFIPGVTTLTYGGFTNDTSLAWHGKFKSHSAGCFDDPNFGVDNHIYFNLLNCQKGQPWVRYNNVGQYHGKTVDLKYTVIDWTLHQSAKQSQNGDYPTISFGTDKIQVTESSYTSRNVKFRVEFVYHGTDTRLPDDMKYHFTSLDMDGAGSQTYADNNLDGSRRCAKESMNIQKSAYDGIYIADTNNMIINRDNGDGTMMIKNDSESQTTDDDINGWVTFLMHGSSFEYSYNIDRWGDAYSTRGFYNHIFDGQSVAKFDSPELYKTVSKSSIYTDDSGYNYELSWSTPVEATEFKYGQIRIEDTLDSYLSKNGNITVQDDSGKDITSMFAVNFDSNTNYMTLVANQPSNDEFYGRSYKITVPVKIKSGVNIQKAAMKNTAKMTTRSMVTSNEVSTKILFRINTSAEHGTITASKNGIEYGTSQTINYSSDSGYALKSVTVDGKSIDIKANPKSYTFSNINKDHTIKAVFVPTYTVTTKGTNVTIDKSESGIMQGGSKTVKWSPADRYAVTSVVVDGKKQTGFGVKDGSYTFDNINADYTIEVVASPFSDLYFFKISTEGVCSVVDPSQAGVPYGANRTIKWKADEGYYVESVTIDGKKLSDEEVAKGSYTFSDIQTDHTVKVVSVKKAYKIITKSTHASIDEGISDIPYGEDRIISFKADDGYYLTSVKVDGKDVSFSDKTQGNYTFSAIKANHSIEVVASPYYKITTKAEHASISDSISKIEGGSDKSVSWKADDGYFIKSVTVDGKAVDIKDKSQGSQAFVNIQADHSVVVVAKPYHRITTSGEHVTIDKTMENVEDGDSRTVKWKCETGYTLSKLIVDGKEVTVADKDAGQQDFKNITADHDVKAVAVIKRFSITTDAKNATVTESQKDIPYGDSRKITWKASDGYHIKSVLIDNASEKITDYTAGEKDFSNITADHDVKVVAEANYKITTKGTHTSITESQQNIYPKESRTIEFTADEGYYISDITVDGKPVTVTDKSKGKYVFSDINENHTIEVTSKIYTYNIVTAGEHTNITPAMNNVEWGTDKTVTWTAEDGYHITKQIVDGQDVPVTDYKKGSTSFTHIDKDHKVSVISEPNYYIDTEAVNATISKKQTNIYPEESRTVTWTANDGYWIQSVTVDGKKQTVEDIEKGSYTFDNIHENHSVSVKAVPKYNIVTSSEHASIDASVSKINPHDSRTIHFSAEDGYWISNITVDGKAVNVADYVTGEYTFADITSDHTIQVIAKPCYNIETEAVNGTITDKQTKIYPHENRQITYQPNEGYYVSEVIVDGHAYSYKDYPSAYDFNDIQTDHRIKVVCEPLKTVKTEITNGTITKTITGIHPDTDTKVIWNSFDDYFVDSVSVDGKNVKVDDFKSGKYEFNPTQTDHTVTVVCKPKPIIYTEIDYGTITKTFNVYPHENADVTGTPSKDRYIIQETVDGTEQKITDETKFQKTFTDVTEDHHVSVVTTKYPELSIQKTSDKKAYNMKDTAHYTIKVGESVSGTYVENVKVTDKIDDDLALDEDSIQVSGVSESDVKISYSKDTRILTVFFKKISSDSDVAITYDAKVKYRKDLAGSQISNDAVVTGDRADSKKSSVDIATLKPCFKVEKTSDKESYNGNEYINYQVALKQTEKDCTAYNVNLDDEIPEGLVLDEDSVTLTGLEDDTYKISVKDGAIHVDMDAVSDLDTVVLSYRAKVGIELTGKSVVNNAVVSIPKTNDDTWNSEVKNDILQPDFKITKKADKESYKAGEYIYYQVDFKQVTKDGAASNVILTDEIPDGLDLDKESVSLTGIDSDKKPEIKVDGNKIECNINSVKDTDMPRLIYKAKVKDKAKGSSIKNIVSLTSDSTGSKKYQAEAKIKVEKDINTGAELSSVLFAAVGVIAVSLLGLVNIRKRNNRTF